MRRYSLRDRDGGATEVVAASLAAARTLAREWVRGGDWGVLESTSWVHVWVEDTLSGESSSLTVAVDPKEPPCLSLLAGGDSPDEDSEEDHRWRAPHRLVGGIPENPGVQGHGGGVFYVEVCVRCGRERHTDTWAQDPETGRQGLTSVSYREGRYHLCRGTGRVEAGDDCPQCDE